jgi:succinate dehydrogenase / fumarate reductase membrane anchor subunit
MSNEHKQDLGAAQTGFHDWYWQRISAVILMVLLPILFVLLFAVYTGKGDFSLLNNMLTHPVGQTLTTLFCFALALHIWTGIKVIFEDYVHTTSGRMFVLNLLLISIVLMTIYMTYHIWADTSYTLLCPPCFKGEG